MKSINLISLIVVTILLSFNASTQDSETTDITIGLNSSFSYKMLEPNQDLRKVSIFIDERSKDAFNDNQLIIGASLIGIMDYQRSNTDSKFAYLMRHPTSNNQIGEEVSEAVIHSFQLSFSGEVNDWLAFYAEMLYNPEQSFGAGTITALGRNQIQLRKGFISIGDLSKFPIYGAVGKMDAPFGQMGSVSPFTNSTMWHAFGGLGYGAQLGFKKSGFHVTAMLVQGGAQFRAMNMPVADSTNIPSRLNNFVGDLNYTINEGKDLNIKLGGSYMLGCAYCQEFPVVHFEPCKESNPAVTGYANINYKNRLTVKGGFATTQEVWPGTFNPVEPLNEFEASKVSSLDAGARYILNTEGNLIYSISGEFSNFRAGADGAPWERQNQIVLGFSGMINDSSKLFLELFRTDGYAPLNFISGGNMADPGETHSDRDAFSHGIVIGGQITL